MLKRKPFRSNNVRLFCGERAVFTWQNIDLYFLPSFVDNNNKIVIISNLCSVYMQTP